MRNHIGTQEEIIYTHLYKIRCNACTVLKRKGDKTEWFEYKNTWGWDSKGLDMRTDVIDLCPKCYEWIITKLRLKPYNKYKTEKDNNEDT